MKYRQLAPRHRQMASDQDARRRRDEVDSSRLWVRILRLQGQDGRPQGSSSVRDSRS